MVLSYLNETYPRIDIQSKQNELSSKFFKTQEISSNDVMTRLKPTPGNGSGTNTSAGSSSGHGGHRHSR